MPLYLGTELISEVYVGESIAGVSTTALTATANGSYTPPSGTLYSGVTVNVPTGSAINNQNKTVTPTTSTQTIQAASGYTGLGTVTVNPIPSEFIVPSGTMEITANGSYNVKSYTTATVNVPTGSTINNQNVTVTPSESTTVVTAGSSYTGLGNVTVNAISSTYVGSQVARNDATDLSVSGPTVTAAAGYYESDVSASVTTASHAAPSITFTTSTGAIKATHTATTGYVTAGTTSANLSLSTQAGKTVTPTESEQTAVAAYKYTTGEVKVAAISSTYVGSQVAQRTSSNLTVSGPTVYAAPGYYSTTASKSVATAAHGLPTITFTTSTGAIKASHSAPSAYITGSTTTATLSLTTKAATTYTPGTTNQTIAAYQYLTGIQTIVGDADLVAGNIKTGVQIFGVTGTFTSDATATAADLNEGKVAYVNGAAITGTQVIYKYYTGTATPGINLGNDGDIYLQIQEV